MKTISGQAPQYNIVEFLGEGTNSCVYRAFKEMEPHGIRFDVALKIPKSKKQLDIWRNEFTRLTRIKSSHCVSLLGWEHVEDRPALVLEFVDGLTLGELVKRTHLNKSEIEEIVSQTLVGLSDLRNAGLYHGDLNLHNIMIDQSGCVKLIDFGVINAPDGLLTTPKYAAPTLLKGGVPSYQTDCFSLNCIRNELIDCYLDASGFAVNSGVADSRSDLGRKVKSGINEKRRSKSKTSSMRFSVMKSNRSTNKLSRLIAITAVFLFTGMVYGDQAVWSQRGWAFISFRSATWLNVYIDNQKIGYSPLDFSVEANKKIVVRWESEYNSGQRALTLSAGQHIVLREGKWGVRQYDKGKKD